MSFLSKLFGSNTKEEKVKPKVEDALTVEQRESIEQEIADLNNKLHSATAIDDKVDIFNQLGALNQRIGNVDEAISNFEKSLETKEAFGPAFDALTKLYNEKRKEAAFAKDDDQIQFWVKKTDDLLAQSKKIMRSR